MIEIARKAPITKTYMKLDVGDIFQCPCYNSYFLLCTDDIIVCLNNGNSFNGLADLGDYYGCNDETEFELFDAKILFSPRCTTLDD